MANPARSRAVLQDSPRVTRAGHRRTSTTLLRASPVTQAAPESPANRRTTGKARGAEPRSFSQPQPEKPETDLPKPAPAPETEVEDDLSDDEQPEAPVDDESASPAKDEDSDTEPEEEEETP